MQMATTVTNPGRCKQPIRFVHNTGNKCRYETGGNYFNESLADAKTTKGFVHNKRNKYIHNARGNKFNDSLTDANLFTSI
jgi:hypothetical protein